MRVCMCLHWYISSPYVPLYSGESSDKIAFLQNNSYMRLRRYQV